MPAPIIALVGIDGAGKSTQARLLVAWLEAQGLPAVHYENPGGRVALDRLGRRVGRGDGRGLLGPAYVAVEATVRWLAITRALLVSRLTARVAVMDRYAHCQYATLRARRDRGERWIRWVFGRFPQPAVVCLLTVAPDVAWQRVELRGRDHEDPAYLAELDSAYRSLPEFGTFTVVDAGRDPDAVQRTLRTAVEPVVRRRRPPAPPGRTTSPDGWSNLEQGYPKGPT